MTNGTYRLLLDYSGLIRQKAIVAAEYATLEEFWTSDFIRQYFGSYGTTPDAYYPHLVKEMRANGKYRLSKLYTIAYCAITPRGGAIILRPEL